MKIPETVKVMNVLNAGSPRAQALFVGGCVRNEIMKIKVDDIDIATRLTPPRVIERLEKAGIKAVPTGIDHGTVTAVIEKKSYEITTLRRDVETDGRHAIVAYTDDWAEDAARRDFTINTLLADENGNIYDPTGCGLRDAAARKVIFVGDPARRIAEDHLRILRFFRFHAYYGSGSPDAEALRACREAAGKIKALSRERITREFLKIMEAGNAAPILELMFGHNIMTDLPGAGYDSAALERLISLQEMHRMSEVLSRLAMLKAGEEALEKYLIFSNARKKTLKRIMTAAGGIKDVNAAAIKKLIYAEGAEMAGQVLLMNAAVNGADADMDLVKTWQPPAFPLRGDDITANGISGPAVGRILKQIEDWWIDNDFAPDRAACLKRIEG